MKNSKPLWKWALWLLVMAPAISFASQHMMVSRPGINSQQYELPTGNTLSHTPMVSGIGGYPSHNSDAAKSIEHRITKRYPECDYESQSYSFDLQDEQGCALNSIRARSVISPHQYNF